MSRNIEKSPWSSKGWLRGEVNGEWGKIPSNKMCVAEVLCFGSAAMVNFSFIIFWTHLSTTKPPEFIEGRKNKIIIIKKLNLWTEIKLMYWNLIKKISVPTGQSGQLNSLYLTLSSPSKYLIKPNRSLYWPKVTFKPSKVRCKLPGKVSSRILQYSLKHS